jgi:hypothetical protein
MDVKGGVRGILESRSTRLYSIRLERLRKTTNKFEKDILLSGGDSNWVPPGYKFQVHTEASMKISVFWVVTPCSLVEIY